MRYLNWDWTGKKDGQGGEGERTMVRLSEGSVV